MNEFELHKLLSDQNILQQKIKEQSQNITYQKVDVHEVQGHLLKAEHNLKFVYANMSLGFLDWCITGCYYACYHAALSLIQTKGYSSKNHMATLYILIREFYNKGLTSEDIDIMSTLLDYQDILFYVESKNKREDASYSSNTKFQEKDVEELRVKSVLFVSKAKGMV